MICSNNENIVVVGVGDLKIARAPKTIKTSLGSCIVIVLYDSIRKTGGLLHIMLPECKNRNDKLSKYADTGIPLFVDLMEKRVKSDRRTLTARIFGGAKMFNVNSDLFDIGKSNAIETKIILRNMGIRIVASRIGGTKGHQISFNTETGIVQSRVLGGPVEEY